MFNETKGRNYGERTPIYVTNLAQPSRITPLAHNKIYISLTTHYISLES